MQVQVRKEEYETAKKLVSEWEKDGVMSQAVRCPQCGSSRIEYPQFSRRTAGSMFFALLSAAHLIPREYYCEDCQFTWPDKVIAGGGPGCAELAAEVESAVGTLYFNRRFSCPARGAPRGMKMDGWQGSEWGAGVAMQMAKGSAGVSPAPVGILPTGLKDGIRNHR